MAIPGFVHAQAPSTQPAAHVADQSALDAAVQQHVTDADQDRETVRRFLQRDEVRQLAGKAGIDMRRADAAVATMSPSELARVAAQAREAEQATRRRRVNRYDLDDDDHHRAAGADPADRRVALGMRRGPGTALLVLALLFAPASLRAQTLTILDVPFIAQSELLCGGAAAAMVMRYWGERGVDAETFAPLVDRRAGGIRTASLVDDLRARRWNAIAIQGSAERIDTEIRAGRPVIALIEERPATFHFVVVVGRNDAGVVFHDPARAPFRVASTAEFDRRWSATNRWMLILTPMSGGLTRSAPPIESSSRADPLGPRSPCDVEVAQAVRQAGENDLASAERTLVSALSCPGSSVFRELAGVRVRQQRWQEAADLAATAVNRDPSDAYAWKILATVRFIEDDKAGALDAWNEADEPRLDLIRVDGLTRTRVSVVQHLIGIKTGDTLTRARLLRARRQLFELPAGPGTLDYEPQASGVAELRGAVVERPLVPVGAADLGVLGLNAAVMREASLSISSPTGGGERIGIDWRFWLHRPLYQVSFDAPAPWSGVWSVTAAREEQPFTAYFARTVHDAVRLDAAAWLTGNVRWQATAGADRWNDGPTVPMIGAAVRMASGADRVDLRGEARSWFGSSRFQRADIQLVARTSTRPEGIVFVADGGIGALSSSAPPDLWLAGDTGLARPLLLRAHPILTDGARFRTERLGRLLAHETIEAQRWWHAGPMRVGGAAFVDSARTARRIAGSGLTDVDVGVGFRAALPGGTSGLRADIARGLRDGDAAISVVFSANLGR